MDRTRKESGRERKQGVNYKVIAICSWVSIHVRIYIAWRKRAGGKCLLSYSCIRIILKQVFGARGNLWGII